MISDTLTDCALFIPVILVLQQDTVCCRTIKTALQQPEECDKELHQPPGLQMPLFKIWFHSTGHADLWMPQGVLLAWGLALSETMFGWLVWVEEQPYERQDPGFPLEHHTAAMIGDIHSMFKTLRVSDGTSASEESEQEEAFCALTTVHMLLWKTVWMLNPTLCKQTNRQTGVNSASGQDWDQRCRLLFRII